MTFLHSSILLFILAASFSSLSLASSAADLPKSVSYPKMQRKMAKLEALEQDLAEQDALLAQEEAAFIAEKAAQGATIPILRKPDHLRRKISVKFDEDLVQGVLEYPKWLGSIPESVSTASTEEIEDKPEPSKLTKPKKRLVNQETIRSPRFKSLASRAIPSAKPATMAQATKTLHDLIHLLKENIQQLESELAVKDHEIAILKENEALYIARIRNLERKVPDEEGDFFFSEETESY